MSILILFLETPGILRSQVMILKEREAMGIITNFLSLIYTSEQKNSWEIQPLNCSMNFYFSLFWVNFKVILLIQLYSYILIFLWVLETGMEIEIDSWGVNPDHVLWVHTSKHAVHRKVVFPKCVPEDIWLTVLTMVRWDSFFFF